MSERELPRNPKWQLEERCSYQLTRVTGLAEWISEEEAVTH